MSCEDDATRPEIVTQDEEAECADGEVQAERRGNHDEGGSSETGFDVRNTEETAAENLTRDTVIRSSDVTAHCDDDDDDGDVTDRVIPPDVRDLRPSGSEAESNNTSERLVGTQHIGANDVANDAGTDAEVCCDAVESSETSGRLVGTQHDETSQQNTSNIDDDDDDDDDESVRLSPRRAPVARFSEFDDFGLDPDLFRPDGLDSADVSLYDKTAKFTRSPSPFYETMLDEDDTGWSSWLCHLSQLFIQSGW